MTPAYLKVSLCSFSLSSPSWKAIQAFLCRHTALEYCSSFCHKSYCFFPDNNIKVCCSTCSPDTFHVISEKGLSKVQSFIASVLWNGCYYPVFIKYYTKHEYCCSDTFFWKAVSRNLKSRRKKIFLHFLLLLCFRNCWIFSIFFFFFLSFWYQNGF